MEIEMLTEVQNFWSSLRLTVMNRQQGLSWSDIGRMPIVSFFHTLKLTERRAMAEQPGKSKGSKAVRAAANKKAR